MNITLSVTADLKYYIIPSGWLLLLEFDGVLLFPPVNSYRRFLIHSTCENYCEDHDLHTFSVGQGPTRRTVICFKSQLLDPNKPTKSTHTVETKKPAAVKSWRSGGEKIESAISSWSSQPSSSSTGTGTTKREIVTTATASGSNMGVEKHLDSSSSASARLNKSHSVDIYRPPALRRNVEPLENYNYQLPQHGDQQQRPQDQKDPLQLHADDINSISNNFSSPASSNSSDTNQNCCNDSDSAATVTATIACSNQRQVRRERRPDRAVYVPRARRSQTTPPSVSTQQQPHNQPLLQAALAVTESNNQLTSLTATSSLSCGINTAPNTTTPTGTCKSPVDEKSLANHSRRLNKERANTSSGRKEKISSKRPSIDENEKLINHKSNNSIGALSSHDNIRDSRIQYNMKNAPLPIAGNEHLNGLSDCNDKNALLVKDCVFSNSKELPDSTNTNSTNVKKRVKIATSEVKKVLPKMSATSPPATTAPTPSLSSQMIPESMGNLRIEDALINGEERSEKCDRDAEELLRASKEINRSNRRIMKQTFNSDVLEIPEKALFNSNTIIKSKSKNESKHVSTSGTEDEQEDDWDSMYNESGDCLDPKILQELTASVGKVRIELPKMDYSAYLSKQSILNEEEFPHVLEVSNFPVEFKNQDLMMLFSQYKESGFDIKWVDDTHALAVFSSSQIAAEILSIGHPFVVLKPLAEATAESRQKAKNCSTSLRPYRPRPETCPALARRLVTGALGVRLKTAAQERENEIRVLREAKERKLLAAKQRDESWES